MRGERGGFLEGAGGVEGRDGVFAGVEGGGLWTEEVVGRIVAAGGDRVEMRRLWEGRGVGSLRGRIRLLRARSQAVVAGIVMVVVGHVVVEVEVEKGWVERMRRGF